jgi:hypothetical protein
METKQACTVDNQTSRTPWNKDKLVGVKPPLRPSHVWSIRTKLQMADRKRDLALFNLAIVRKQRGCDVVAVRVDDVAPSGYAMDRTIIRQKKTGRPVLETRLGARFLNRHHAETSAASAVRAPERCQVERRSIHGKMRKARPKAGLFYLCA